MKVFLVLPFLFLLFGSSKESTLSHKRSIRGLNTTLQTNFNGTYQRKNPCTNADVEVSSYVASHEFHHHIKEDNWSDYTHKCSAIISSFLQGIGNLVRFNSKQNGTFNFHINTSISQKQDGLCISPDKKKCNSLPTIIIEASSCELPPPCKSSSDTEEHNERVQIAAHEDTNLSSQDDETLTEVRRNSAKIIPKTLTTLKPKEKKNFNLENYSTTPRCSTEGASETNTVNEGLDTEGKLRKGQKPISINDGSKNKNFIPISGFSESNPQGKIGETKDSSRGFSDDFLQNIQVTPKPKQNFEFLETSKSGRNFITSVTIQPEDEYATAYSDEKAITDYETLPRKADQQSTFGSENSEYMTSPLSPVTWEGFTEENSFTTPGTLNFPYYPTQTDSEFETTPQSTFVNDENQYQPSRISEKQIFDALNEEIPDFQFNKTLPSTISSVTTLSSNLADNFRLRQQTQSVRGIADMNINTTPNPKFSTPDQQNEEMPEISDSLKFKNPASSGSNPRVSFSIHSNHPETSSYLSQTSLNEEYDEPMTKPPEVENFYPSTTQTTISQVKTSANAFIDFGAEDSLKPTTPTAVYSDQQQRIPTTPLPFLKDSADRRTNAEVTYIPESDQETEISYTDGYYHRPTTHLFTPAEENYEPSTERTDNSFTKQAYSRSSPRSLPDNDKQTLHENINESILSSDQPLIVSTRRYSDPPKMPPTVAPEIRFAESPTSTSKTDQQSTDFKVSQKPYSDSEIITYRENTIPPKYSSPPESEFYDDQSQSEFTKNLPSEFFPTTPSLEYLTTPSNQIPPPPVLFSGTPDNQQSYDNQSYAHSNDFQPKPQPSLTNETPFYIQSSRRPNAQIFSDDYVTTSPHDSFLQKPKLSTVAYTEEKLDRNLDLRYPDQVMTNPVPTLYSESITSNGYTTPNDYHDSSFFEPKVQSFNDFYAPTLKEPFPSTEKFSDPLIKYSTELRKTTPGFENDSPINPNEQPSSYPDVYSTTPLPEASDTDLLEKTIDEFYSPVTKEPHEDKKISLKLSFEKSSADKPRNAFTTASPRPENFAKYDFQSPDESSKFQDVTDDGESEPTTDEEFFIKNQSSPPSLLRNDEYFSKEQSFLNVETTPNYKSSEYTEQVSSDDYKKPDFDPLLIPTSAKQNFNPEFEEFDSLITPLPPVTYPEDDFYSSDNLPNLQNSPTFDEPRRQIQNEAFEPTTYAEASLQASAEVYENQNNQPVFNSNTDDSEQYSSVSSASLQKKTSSFDSNPKNNNDQSSEFLTSSDEQVTDSIAGFQQPKVNYMKGYRSGLNDANTNQLSSGIKGPGQQPFVGPERTTFFEPENQPTAKPAEEPKKSGFSNFKNSDRPNSEDYSNDFLATTQSSEILGFSKAQAQSFVRYSDVQPDLDIQSESIISNSNNQRTTDSQYEVYQPFWTDRPSDLIDPQPLAVTNSTVVSISNASPDSQSTQSSSSKTLYHKNILDSPFSSQADLKLLNEFPSTVSPSQSIRTAGYPQSQLQPPIDYYDEEVSDPHLQQSVVSLDTISVPRAQSKQWTNKNYLPTPATSYEDSTPAEEPFASDSTIPPTPQISSYLKSQEIPNYSPPFALEPEPQPQPQPSYDKFSDISSDNTPFLASRTSENPKITNQYPVTSFQNYLDTQEASGFRKSLSPKFNEPTTAVSYIPKRPLSDDLVTTATPFSVTDIPSFQTSFGSDLKSEELITNSKEHSQENTGVHEALILDNVSPQPQPATAVKYDEENIQYQTSPGPNPQPQTTLNNADQLSDDNSNEKLSEFFTNQQRLVTSDPIFYPKASSAEQTAVVHTSKSLFQSKSEMTEELSTPARDKDLQHTKKTFEQEIITTDYPIEVTSRPLNYPNPDSRGSFLPYNNQPHSQPVHQKPSSREQKLLIGSSTGSFQRSTEYFKDETLRPPQLSDSDVNYEKEQKRDSSQISQSNERFESFIPYNEPHPMVSRIPNDISETHAPPRVQPNPMPKDYRNDFDDYDWMTRSSDHVPGRPRSLTPNSQVPPEHFFYPNDNLNYNSRELLRPSPQELSRRFSRPKEAEFTPGFPRSFEPRRSFSPMSQLSNFPKTQTKEIITDSHASSYNPHVQPPSLASSNDAKGTTTTKVVKEIITTDLPTAITDSPIQKQLAYADRILNNDKGILETQSLSSSLKENRRRFQPSETLDQTFYRPPIPEYEPRTFRQHPRNNPQQVKPFSEGFSPNVSYPDYPQRRLRINPAFPGQDYAEYSQVFPNPPPRQKFELDEVIPQESQRMGHRHQLFDRRGIEERPYFHERPSQRPVNYTPDRKPLEFPPSRAVKQQYSNPLFHTLESHMTLPLEEPPPPAIPNESILFEPNHQKNFRDNSPSSHGWELPNAPSPHQQGITKSHQSESQLVSDLTDPSNNPDRSTNGRFSYMDGSLRKPFYEDRMRPVSTPERF